MIQGNKMNKIIEVLKSNRGYARMKDLREKGIQTRDIANAVEEGILEKIKPGFYKLVNYSWDEHESFATVCNVNNRAIICLLSAAAYWELTTYNPNQIDVAVPMNTDKFTLEYPQITVYYFGSKFYDQGIEILQTKSGVVRIYNKEKTICDLFRYQKKLGEDLVIESLKTYINDKKKKNIPRLMQYAESNNVFKKVEVFLKGMI